MMNMKGTTEIIQERHYMAMTRQSLHTNNGSGTIGTENKRIIQKESWRIGIKKAMSDRGMPKKWEWRKSLERRQMLYSDVYRETDLLCWTLFNLDCWGASILLI